MLCSVRHGVNQGARSEVWWFQMSDEQQRVTPCPAEPEGRGLFSRHAALLLAYVAGPHCARSAWPGKKIGPAERRCIVVTDPNRMSLNEEV